jgi:hypothetical protein
MHRSRCGMSTARFLAFEVVAAVVRQLQLALPAEAFQLSKHLIRCKPCAEMVRALKDATNALTSMPAPAGAGLMPSLQSPIARLAIRLFPS